MNDTTSQSIDPLVAFKADLRARLSAALDRPTPASLEVQRMLQDLGKADSALQDTSLQEVRSALENILQQECTKRGLELAQAVCDVADGLGIPIKPASRTRAVGSCAGRSRGTSGGRSRYTPEQRQQITWQLLEGLRARGSDGLTKVELAEQLNMTTNQIKRVLQWPEVASRVVPVGQGRQRRYALKGDPAPEQPAPKRSEAIDASI